MTDEELQAIRIGLEDRYEHVSRTDALALLAEVERLRKGWDHVRYVHDRFEESERLGYHTRDREFAISLLSQALKSLETPKAS